GSRRPRDGLAPRPPSVAPSTACARLVLATTTPGGWTAGLDRRFRDSLPSTGALSMSASDSSADLTPSASLRRHDLDALRAFAMLLGMALHASLSFSTLPWIVHDTRQSELYSVFMMAVHGFRMPLFFLVSGFFTAMLWRRRGLASLLKQRAVRILVPCL